jgi:hypothetical protein
VGCSLNADQEASLNRAMMSYVNSHNNGTVMSFVSFTHPDVVGYYENKGDEAFRKKFELFAEEDGGDFLQDGIIREIESEGNNIHVEYTFMSIENRIYEQVGKELEIIAISEDNGSTWFFVDATDYINDAIFDKKKRLL